MEDGWKDRRIYTKRQHINLESYFLPKVFCDEMQFGNKLPTFWSNLLKSEAFYGSHAKC
jgi:hypothetical protein